MKDIEEIKIMQNEEITKCLDRKQKLFDHINFMTLGAESDYQNLFQNKKIYKMYKRIEKLLFKLAILMSNELTEKII